MKVFSRLALGVVALMLHTNMALAQTQPAMSLEECIEYALDNHTEVKNKVIDTYKAKAKVGETRAMGLPQFNFATQVNANPDIRPVVVPNVEGTPFFDANAGETVALPFGVTYDGTATLSASQLLFDGSYIVGLMAAKTYKELSNTELVQTRIDRVEAVKKAYYLVLVNQKSLNSLESNVNRLKVLVDETAAMLEQGLIDETDLDRLKVNYNNSLANKNSVNRGLDLSMKLLKYHMAMPLGETLVLQGKLDESAVLDNTNLLTNDFNFSDRVEFQLLQVNADLAKLNMRQYQVQYLPKLELVGNMGYSTGYNNLGDVFTDKWYWSSAIGLKLSLPIFDGLKKHYQVKQAKFERDQISNQKENLKQGISIEIQQAQTGLMDNKEMLDISRQNMELASKVFNRTKAMYQSGLGSNLEVVQADDDYRQAESNYFNSLYQAIIARIELEKATGKLYK